MRFNSLIPELSVSDFSKSLKFYTDLGFKIEYDRPEKKFALLSYQGSQVMINQHNGVWQTGKFDYPLGRGINFQIECRDVRSLIKTIEKQNYQLFQEVEENWYRQNNQELGCREFLIQDPDGYLLRFSQDLGKNDSR
ncbi:MAG: VOC family protein [Candidatus Shapirobacteria bacterium]|nr:VOC family protein [Candidatus Shapirobacteria bacterium]